MARGKTEVDVEMTIDRPGGLFSTPVAVARVEEGRGEQRRDGAGLIGIK